MKQVNKWSQIITENKELQRDIESKVNSFISHGNSQDDEYREEPNKDIINGIQDRAVEMLGSYKEFVALMNYILLGSKESEAPEERDREDVIQSETKKGTKHKIAKAMLAKFSADEIMGMCKNRYNLLTMQDFLLHLNQLNAASSGNLLKDKK